MRIAHVNYVLTTRALIREIYWNITHKSGSTGQKTALLFCAASEVHSIN